jgi:23S rRNA-/tRNA-specific pseudouridylate synthase
MERSEILTDRIKILWQTENEAVVYKPEGISVQLSNDVKGSSLESILKNKLGKDNIYFPHRLDRVTCGLLLICFDKATAAYYGDLIKNGEVSKYYKCLSEKTSTADISSFTGIHKRYLKTDNKVTSIVKSGGKPSFLEILSIEPSKEHESLFLITIRLITGRTHQIRAMLSDIGLPLAGDKLYYPFSKYKNFYLESFMLKFKDHSGSKRSFQI